MSDGRDLRTAGNRVVLIWLLAMAVGLGGVALVEGAFVRIGGSTGGPAGGAVARLGSAGTLEGSGHAESDRTPIPVAIRRDRQARRDCALGDRVPIPVMDGCRSQRRAGSASSDRSGR